MKKPDVEALKENMKIILKSILSTFIISQVALAEGVKDIINQHAQAQISEINNYIKINPQANDLLLAYKSLSELYDTQSDAVKSLGALDTVYTLTKETDDFEPRIVFMNIIQPYLERCQKSGLTSNAIAKLTLFNSDFSSHPEAAIINNFVAQIIGELQKPQIGGTMEIAFTSVNGKEKIDLSELKGKVVLIDFWATWCAACISELPYVKKTYETYHDKGFEIIAISLDRNKKDLIKFIEDNKLPWPQCFDEGQAEPFSSKYGISLIPATFLINQQGKIVATNLQGTQLESKVAELLSE